MLSVFATTEKHADIRAIIQQEDRLEELVTIFDLLAHPPSANGHTIIIRNDTIVFPIDWHNTLPPFLLPESIDLTANNLLGVLFAKLNNYEKAHVYLRSENPALLTELDFINRLQQGIPTSPDTLISHYSPFEEYRLMHNNAILQHYASVAEQFDAERVAYFYEEAMKSSPSDEHRAFTARHYALLCIDLQQPQTAERILSDVNTPELSKTAKIELQHTLCQIWLARLTKPYDAELLQQLKSNLWEVLEVYEKQKRDVETALLLLDAVQVATISESFSEALGYLNRAISIFEAEQMTELIANTYYRKGTLLHVWSKKGNPQFVKPAIDAFQRALKTFTKEQTPDVFADIHHHLAVLYAEMPTEHKRKSILAGVSVASFEEALTYFTKADFPYQYGVVCNDYGNAFLHYPKAVLTDNAEKALHHYQEALDVRTKDYPYERAMTLLNFLEASWQVGNDPDAFNEARYEDMVAKAEEIKTLVEDEEIRKEAERHLKLLEELREKEVADTFVKYE